MPDEALNQSFYDTWVLLGELVEDAWLRRGEDTVFGITGVPAPTLNGVWSGSERLDRDGGGRRAGRGGAHRAAPLPAVLDECAGRGGRGWPPTADCTARRTSP